MVSDESERLTVERLCSGSSITARRGYARTRCGGCVRASFSIEDKDASSGGTPPAVPGKTFCGASSQAPN